HLAALCLRDRTFSTRFYHSPFFFHAPPTTQIYTLSLHDALPISAGSGLAADHGDHSGADRGESVYEGGNERVRTAIMDAFGYFQDRKSTRLNSSHVKISYAVFCLKKKKQTTSLKQYIDEDSAD